MSSSFFTQKDPFFDPNDYFVWAIAFGLMVTFCHFGNLVIFQILGLFLSRFYTEQLLCGCRIVFGIF